MRLFTKKLNRSFPGLPINGRFMERLEGNRLYFLLGNEKILDIFFLRMMWNIKLKVKKLTSLSKRNIDVFFKLNLEEELLFYKAFCLNGEYFFSFYDDDQDPFSNVDKVIDAKRIKEGFSLQIGKSYNFSY